VAYFRWGERERATLFAFAIFCSGDFQVTSALAILAFKIFLLLVLLLRILLLPPRQEFRRINLKKY
jgi:hypothetical protein